MCVPFVGQVLSKLHASLRRSVHTYLHRNTFLFKFRGRVNTNGLFSVDSSFALIFIEDTVQSNVVQITTLSLHEHSLNIYVALSRLLVLSVAINDLL